MLVLALAACGEDPSLRVNIDWERPPVHRVVVSVYEAPSITCEQVAYADLTEAQLDALLVDEQSITDGVATGTLDNLSRTEHKLIVARGYSQTGELLEAGCAAHDLVVENDSVTVKTHVIADVSAQQDFDNPSPVRIGTLVTDRDGVPLRDRPVSWRVIGPAGSEETQSTNVMRTGDGLWQPIEPACTGANGTTPVYPVTPNLVGGFAVSVRAAWAIQPQTVFSGVTNTDFQLTNLDIPTETKRPCAVSVKRAGGATVKRLVCIDGNIAHEFPVTLVNGSAVLGTSMTTTLPRTAIGLFALPNESDPALSDVYALDKDGVVTALFGAPAAAATLCPECVDHVVDAIVAPACGGRDVAKMLMVVRPNPNDDKVKVMPVRGGLAVDVGIGDTNVTIGFNNAGCVTTIGPQGYEPRQLTVIDIVSALGPAITRGFYNCLTACKRVILPTPESAVGFTKTSPPYLIGAASDASGIVLATWGLVPDPEDTVTDRLVERAQRVSTSALPANLAIGTYDEDDGSDMIWDIPARSRGGTNFQLSYSSATGVRLQALSASLPLDVVDLFSTDVTGDDHDDIIIVARALGGTTSGVTVIPTHAVAPPNTIPVSTCAN